MNHQKFSSLTTPVMSLRHVLYHRLNRNILPIFHKPHQAAPLSILRRYRLHVARILSARPEILTNEALRADPHIFKLCI